MKKNCICLITGHKLTEHELVILLANVMALVGDDDDYIWYTFNFVESNEFCVIKFDKTKRLLLE